MGGFAMRHVIFSLMLFAFGLGTATAQDDQAKKDLEKLQGSWKAETAIMGGEKAPAEQLAKMGLTFKGNEVIPAENPKDVATIKLDPSKKPAQMDLTEKNKTVSQGIYEIDGDTLKLCFSEPGEGRPKTFESPKGKPTFFLVLKRVKK
jgi:uncharacterized protein (TIGR03067 family)